MSVAASRIARVLVYLAMLAGLLMALGSCDFRTRRESAPNGPRAAGYEVDGFAAWAGVTLPLAIIAVGLLGNVGKRMTPGGRSGGNPSRSTVALTTAGLACFALATFIAARYWRQVLVERADADYEVHIAGGLPVVAVSGSAAIVVTFALIIVLVMHVRGELRTGAC